MRVSPDNRLRKEIAQEAARLVAVDGFDDYLQAKLKAAQQLGINNRKMLPSNIEIEAAVIEYQSLFQADTQPRHLRRLRKLSCKAMKMLAEYQPKLVGPVLSGTASMNSEIILHVFVDTPELIGLFLKQQGIPFEVCERRLSIEKNNPAYYTAYKFLAEDIEIVLITLPMSLIRQSPVDPVSGGSMKRAGLTEVEKLIH